jgi:hypothetical protein
MAITRTQIAKQLLEQGGRAGFQGGGADMGGERAQGRSRDTGGSERDRRRGDKGIGAGRNPISQFSGGANTEGVTFMDEARRNVNPLGVLTELPGTVGMVSRALTPNPFGFSNSKPFITPDGGGSPQMDSSIPLWAQLGFNSEAEYLASLQAQETMDQETEVEEPFKISRRFAAGGGMMDVVGGEYDFESARQMYGLGKLVKKVTRTVKKIAKSPIGKAALLYTGAGALGNLAAGTGLGGAFKGFTSPTSFLAKNKLAGIFSRAGAKNILFGASPVSMGGNRGVGEGIMTKGTSGLFGFGGELSPLKAITAASTLAGLMTPEQENEAQQLSDNTGIDIEEARRSILNAGTSQDFRAVRFRAEGGSTEGKEPVAKKTMPLLDMDGMEKDYRETGGFVEMGRMEKADDVPARLSKNEFVFTADAVRNAGDGDVDKGAEVMYNMMKNLEAGGEVSEESQGLEGARKMFQTSQRLEEVL